MIELEFNQTLTTKELLSKIRNSLEWFEYEQFLTELCEILEKDFDLCAKDTGYYPDQQLWNKRVAEGFRAAKEGLQEDWP